MSIPPNNPNAKARLEKISAQLNPSAAMASPFAADVVPQAPEDPLFGLMAAYRADTSPKKVDLGIGAYRDDNAKPWILPVVKKVIHFQRVCVTKNFVLTIEIG
jgi:aspartate aminotransferase